MKDLGGVFLLLGALALLPSLKLMAEIIDAIGRKLTRKSGSTPPELKKHMQEQL
jgi:hypothetical protein